MDQNLSAYIDPRQVPSRGPLRREDGDADPGVMASQAFALVGEVIKGPKGPMWAVERLRRIKFLWYCAHGSHKPSLNKVPRPAFCSSRGLFMSNPPELATM